MMIMTVVIMGNLGGLLGMVQAMSCDCQRWIELLTLCDAVFAIPFFRVSCYVMVMVFCLCHTEFLC